MPDADRRGGAPAAEGAGDYERWSELIPRLAATFTGVTFTEWLTMPKAWIRAFAEAEPALAAEQSLRLAEVAMLPALRGSEGASARRRVLEMWTATARSRRRGRGRNGLYVAKTATQYRGWFDGAYHGRK